MVEFLKKKIICAKASFLVKKDWEMISKKFYMEGVAIQSKYYSNKMKDMPYEICQNRVIWEKDEKGEVEMEFPRQVLEIEKLNLNIKKLKDIRKNFSNYDEESAVLDKYISVLEKARRIYSQGKDDEKFDKTVEMLNKFMDSHILRKWGKEYFTSVAPKDEEFGIFPYRIVEGYRISRINLIEDEFSQILEY